MLEKISKHIMLYSCSTLNIGLINGKMGAIIYFYCLARYTRKHIYSEFAKELLEQLYEIININHTTCFGDGLAGIAWGIDFLMINKFIYADSDDILEELDDQILKINLNNIDNPSLLYGLEGYAFYVMSRYIDNKFRKKKEYYDFVNNLLFKFKNLENDNEEKINICNNLNKILVGNNIQNFNTILFNHIIYSTEYNKDNIFDATRVLGILNNGYAAIGLKIITQQDEKYLYCI